MRAVATMAGALLGAAFLTSCSRPAGSGETDMAAAQRDAQRRAEKFRAEVKKAKDPVALAIQMTRDKFHVCAVAGMDVLVEHWEDPRSEKTLAKLAKGGPIIIGGLPTTAGKAMMRWDLVQAKKKYKVIMAGSDTPAKKMKAIRAAFKKHPRWLSPAADLSGLEVKLASMLIETAIATAGGEAMDLVVAWTCLSDAELDKYVSDHRKAAVSYARRIGRKRALAEPRFLAALANTEDKSALKLFEEWLKQEVKLKNQSNVNELVSAVTTGKGGKQRLLKFLSLIHISEPTRPY